MDPSRSSFIVLFGALLIVLTRELLSGKGFSMHGVKYAWNGKVFKQNQVSIETKRFKVN